MEDPNQGVNPEVSPTPNPVPTEPAVDPNVSQEPNVNTQDPTPEQGQAPEVITDRPQLNIDSEWKRKYNDVVDQIPQMLETVTKEVKETIVETTQQNQQPKHTLKDVEVFLRNEDISDADRLWAIEEKQRLLNENTQNIVKQALEQERKTYSAQQTRLASEQAVLNDPTYADAFIKVAGTNQVTYNPNSQLAALISQNMKDPALAERPDAIVIAAKLAYADVMRAQGSQTQSAVTDLQRKNAVLAQSTMPAGAGVNPNQTPQDPYQQAYQEFREKGGKQRQSAMVKAFLKKTGKI